MGAGGDILQQSYTRVPRSSALSKPFSNIISKKPNFLAVSGCWAQGLAWKEGPWQERGEERWASAYLQRARKLPQLQLSQKWWGRRGVGQDGGSKVSPLDRAPAPTRPFIFFITCCPEGCYVCEPCLPH